MAYTISVNPPAECKHCHIKGIQNFYHDTTRISTYRCRQCGEEHYTEPIATEKPRKSDYYRKRNGVLQ